MLGLQIQEIIIQINITNKTTFYIQILIKIEKIEYKLS